MKSDYFQYYLHYFHLLLTFDRQSEKMYGGAANPAGRLSLPERRLDMEAVLISFVEDYLKSGSVPVHRITLPCDDYSWMDFGLRSAFPEGHRYQVIQTYFESVEPNTIHNLLDTFGCIYTTLRLPDSAELMVCGPVMFGHEGFPVRAAQDYLNLPVQSFPVLEEFYLQVTVFQHQTAYYNIFKTLGRYIYGENSYKIINDSLNDLEYWYKIHQQILNLQEDPAAKLQSVEKWYNMERELMDALCNGNEAVLLDAISNLQSIAIPNLLSEEIYDLKACSVMFETLLRKSAEIAGVSPILFDPYSKRHIQMTEQITSKTEMNALLMQFIRDYYLLIHQHSLKQYSLLTQKTISLIDQDITADLSLSVLSERLNSNAKYLSALFKKEVGITLTDYVNGQRIELAKRLLLFTNFPIKVVSHKCGIPDVPYFSRLFKKWVGCTPKFFRDNHLRN